MADSGLTKIGLFAENLYRITIASIAAAIVFCVLSISAWVNLSENDHVCRSQGMTRNRLSQFARNIDDFRTKNGTLPSKLTDVPEVGVLAANARLDRWNRPIEYHPREDGTYDLFSLGRDGVPGGVGFDADLYHDKREGRAAKPSLVDFYLNENRSDVNSIGFLIAALAAGLVVAVTVFQTLALNSSHGTSQGSAGVTFAGIAVVSILACVVGIILMPLHIPNGH